MDQKLRGGIKGRKIMGWIRKIRLGLKGRVNVSIDILWVRMRWFRVRIILLG